jgi:L-ascorbate metabolism protein UlaG (beta-lactamase superfamily)
MKAVKILLLLSITFSALSCAASEIKSPIAITYVASSGFMVECNGKKFLVDAPIGEFTADWCYVPDDSLVELAKLARPPFDNIDLIAITHAHVDHFNANLTASHMKNNLRAVLVGPPQVAEAMAALPDYPQIKDRIRPIWVPGDTGTTIEVGDIRMHILSGRHNSWYEEDTATGEKIDIHRDVQNLEFLFTIEGWMLFHSGDSPMNDREVYRTFGFGESNIDFAFMHWWDARENPSFRQVLIRDIIRPDRIIFKHLAPTRPPRGNPERETSVAKEVIIPEQLMQKWAFNQAPVSPSGH